tara:strand:- start:1168 stop:1431 length:264 start_codon:yes stop_codon:yes gene_type:complete
MKMAELKLELEWIEATDLTENPDTVDPDSTDHFFARDLLNNAIFNARFGDAYPVAPTLMMLRRSAKLFCRIESHATEQRITKLIRSI